MNLLNFRTPHPSLVKLVPPSPAGEGFLLIRLSKSGISFLINCRDRRPRRSKNNEPYEDNKSIENRRGDSRIARFTPHPPLCGILTTGEGFLLVCPSKASIFSPNGRRQTINDNKSIEMLFERPPPGGGSRRRRVEENAIT